MLMLMMSRHTYIVFVYSYMYYAYTVYYSIIHTYERRSRYVRTGNIETFCVIDIRHIDESRNKKLLLECVVVEEKNKASSTHAHCDRFCVFVCQQMVNWFTACCAGRCSNVAHILHAITLVHVFGVVFTQ